MQCQVFGLRYEVWGLRYEVWGMGYEVWGMGDFNPIPEPVKIFDQY